MQFGVSIVVCTYNGAKRLSDTLQYLTKQSVDDLFPWEVIIVDNASTDNTHEVVKKLIAAYQNFSLVKENKIGKSNALETGFRIAKYEYILICDDDNWLDENYLLLAYKIMESNKNIGVLGGKSIAVCEVKPPDWFDSLNLAYAVGSQNKEEKSGYVDVIWGAGMVLRKSAWHQLQAVGFRQILSCRNGSKLTSGGDDELCLAFQLAGYKVFYDSRLVLKHFIPRNRLSKTYIKNLIRSTAYSAIALEPYLYVMTMDKKTDNLHIYKDKWRKKSYGTVKELIKDFKKYLQSQIYNDFAYCVLYEKKVELLKLYLLHSEEMYRNLLQVHHLKINLDARKHQNL